MWLEADAIILMSSFPCLYLMWTYISLFLPPPLLSCPSLPWSLTLYQCLSLCVCLFMCFSPSLLPPVLLLSIFPSLSLTLAVSTFGENSTGAPPGKVLPLSSTFPPLSGQIGFSLFLSFLLWLLVLIHRSSYIHICLRQVQIDA